MDPEDQEEADAENEDQKCEKYNAEGNDNNIDWHDAEDILDPDELDEDDEHKQAEIEDWNEEDIDWQYAEDIKDEDEDDLDEQVEEDAEDSEENMDWEDSDHQDDKDAKEQNDKYDKDAVWQTDKQAIQHDEEDIKHEGNSSEDQNKFSLMLSYENWRKIPILSGKYQRHLGGDWTDIFSHAFNVVEPRCVLAFRYNRVTRSVYAKRGCFGHFKAYCTYDTCRAEYDMKIKTLPTENNDVQAFVTREGKPSDVNAPKTFKGK